MEARDGLDRAGRDVLGEDDVLASGDPVRRRIGWLGRSGMMGLIGFFLARAAVRFDPNEAQGLDGSLRKAAESGAGTWLVIAVGAALIVYGVFCVLSAPKQRLVGADS